MLNNYQYSMWSLVRDLSEHDEIFHLEKKEKNWMRSMIYWLAFFHMAKFSLCCCSWSCKIRVCWPVGLICLSWSLYFWSCLRGLWINNKQWEDVAFCGTGFQMKLFVPLEAKLLQTLKFLFYRLLKKESPNFA